MRYGLALFLLGSAAAQDLTGVLSGTARDTTGGVIPGASVIITNAATGVQVWRGRTDAAGRYLAPAIPVGRYDLNVEAAGFKKAEIRGVSLQVDQRARVDLTLQPGDVVETVTVVGESLGQLETETASVGRGNQHFAGEGPALAGPQHPEPAHADTGRFERRRGHRHQRQPALH